MELGLSDRHHHPGGLTVQLNKVHHLYTSAASPRCSPASSKSTRLTGPARTRQNRQPAAYAACLPLLDDIRLIHAESSGTYGSPRVHAVLRGHGRRVGRSRIERLMRRAGLRGLAALPRRARTTDSRHGYPIAPNRLARNFQAAAPNQIWLADLTYIPTGEGWLYLAAILDMHTRKIVGWSMRQTLHTEIALEALHMAIERQRPPPGLIHHSDRGIQYAAEAYRQALAASGISPSMSRKGDCWDNAPMESFFHTLKTERVHHRVYATRADARRDLFGYIGVLQSTPPAFSPRLHQPSGHGARNRLTLSTFSGEDQTIFPQYNT
jgi:putative transposase